MNGHSQQLVRLGELMDVSAGVLRDLLTIRNFDGQTGSLNEVADEIERLAAKIKEVGRSGLPRSRSPT